MTSRPPAVSPPVLPRLAGLVLELWVVIALFAGAGAYLVISVLVVLPDALRLFGSFLGPRWALLVLILLLIVGAIGAALLAIAGLLYQRSRVGRGLAYVASGVVALSVILSDNRTTAQVVALFASLAAGAILAFAPAVRDDFTGVGAPASDQPTSVVIARVLLAIVSGLLALLGCLYLLVADVDSEFAVLGVVSLALAGGALFTLIRLAGPDRQARLLASAGAGVGIVLILALSERNTAEVVPVGILAGIAGCLWLPKDARAFFGDSPLDLGGAPPRPVRGVPAIPVPAPPPPGPGIPRSPGPGRRPEPRPAVPRMPYPAAPAFRSAFCTGCGTALGADERFCTGCGQPNPGHA